MVTLQLGVGGLSDNALSSEVFDLYKVLFLRILNTFHITDNDASKSSKMADEINQHFTSAIHQTILLAILLPIGAICLLAIILRYGVIHHSMNKKNAAMASTAIGLTSVTVLYFVSGDSGALGAAIGSLLFYAIVRIGHTEYDAEVARLEEEKASVNQMREEVAQAKEKADKELTHASKIKDDASKIWTEAKDAIEKADNIRKFADIEIERLKEELIRVQERNKRLEEERNQKDQSSKSEPFRKDRAYYENVIGISQPYTKEALKKQYRQKTSLYHPDKVVYGAIKRPRVRD